MYHFTEQVNNGKIEFDYKLKDGVLKHTNAINILEHSHYPKELVDEARACASDLRL